MNRKLHATKEDLTELYLQKGFSLRAIGEQYGVYANTVSNNMEAYNIPRRSLSKAQEKLWKKEEHRDHMVKVHKGPRPHRRKFCLSKKELHSLYWNEKLNSYQIADMFNVHERTVSRWIKKHSIPKRTLSEAMLEKWKKDEFRVAVLENLMKWNKIIREEKLNLHSSRPTRPERKVIEIIEANEYPFEYTGDGSYLIGSLNPDFVATDGSRKLIEVFGRVFHDPDASFVEIPETSTEEGRVFYFKEYGWSTLILWDDEIFDESFDISTVIGGFLNG